jgi:hypothetical protein
MSFKRIEFTKKVTKMVEVLEKHNEVVYVPFASMPHDVIRYTGHDSFEYSANGGESWTPLRIHDWIGPTSDIRAHDFLEALCALIKTYDAESVS